VKSHENGESQARGPKNSGESAVSQRGEKIRHTKKKKCLFGNVRRREGARNTRAGKNQRNTKKREDRRGSSVAWVVLAERKTGVQ